MGLDKKGIVTNVIATMIAAGLLAAFSFLTEIGRVAWCALINYVRLSVGLFTRTYDIYGWVIAILLVFSLPAVIKLRSSFIKKSSPRHYSYTKDTISGAVWKWSWYGNKVTNLWCYCPICDATLVYDDSACDLSGYIQSRTPGTTFFCERCRQNVATIPGGDNNYAVAFVDREIQRRVRTGEYLG